LVLLTTHRAPSDSAISWVLSVHLLSATTISTFALACCADNATLSMQRAMNPSSLWAGMATDKVGFMTSRQDGFVKLGGPTPAIP
jgi:hypothetical protein